MEQRKHKWTIFLSCIAILLLIFSFFLPDSMNSSVQHTGVPNHSGEGLIAYWPFDEDEGDIVFDSTGQQHDGAILGGTWEDIRVGNALRFKGGAGVFVQHTSNLMPQRAISMAMWVKVLRAGNENYHGLIGKGGYSSGYRLLIHHDTGKILFQLTGKAGYNLRSDQTIPINEWHHIVATYDGSLMKLYLDGEADTHEKRRAGPIDGNTFPLIIGKPQYGINGLLDEVRIYNRALSEEEVPALLQLRR